MTRQYRVAYILVTYMKSFSSQKWQGPPICSFSGITYNQPKLCSNAQWNPNAITFGNQSQSLAAAYGIFVDRNNTIYLSDKDNNRAHVWKEGSVYPIRNLSGDIYNGFSIFVASNDDIYVSNGPSGRVDRWLVNATSSVSGMYINADCYSVFIDINNTLYCCASDINIVVSMPIDDASNKLTLVAGKSCAGSSPDTLKSPDGIFVDINFTLYVADSDNDRIQMFLPGQMNATTVAGSGAPGTIDLHCPTGVVLAGDNYLFIVDAYNHRIVGSGPNGFRCVAGCSNTAGSTSDHLRSPRTMAFDSFGNIWVADYENQRVQKFLLEIDSCSKCFSFILQ